MQEIMNSQMAANTKKSSVVKLDQLFDLDRKVITEVFATLDERGVTLTRISSASKTREFGFSAEVMDSLCDAWINFKNECHDIEVDEAHRIKMVLKEVDAIVAECPNIIVKKHGNDQKIYAYWSVTVEKLNFYTDDIDNADKLLEVVQSHKTRLTQRKADQQTVNAILDAHPEITVKSNDTGNHVWVNVSYGEWTRGIVYAYKHDSQEILEAVQDAEKDLVEHKAEHATKELEAYAAAYKANEDVAIQLTDCRTDIRQWRLDVPQTGVYDTYIANPIEMLKVIKEEEAEIAEMASAALDAGLI